MNDSRFGWRLAALSCPTVLSPSMPAVFSGIYIRLPQRFMQGGNDKLHS